MRRSTRSGRAGALLSAALGLLGCEGCQRAAPPAAESESAPSSSVVSLYDLDLEFRNQDAESISLASFEGRPLVAAMMYTSCKSACPRIAADLRRIQDEVPANGPQAPLFVMWSLDPARDTPEALREFARANGLDPERWQLLSGSEEGALELAAVLDVRFRPEESGEIAHSSLVFVIDRGGHIVHRQLSSEGDEPILDAVTRASRP